MQRWSPPSRERPTVESKRYFSPTPDDLRALVFDYLCHGSFTNTARAFMRETDVNHFEDNNEEAMDVDDGAAASTPDPVVEERLRSAQLRRDVRIQILSGNVDEAIRLLQLHFPAVLSQDAHEHSVPRSTARRHSFTYIHPQSIDATHLLLNLRILAFIETARTQPLPYYPPGSRARSSSTGRITSGLPGHSNVRDDAEPNERQQVLLHKAQRLYSDANCLHNPEDRANYVQELARVSALLVYKVPEESDLALYLSQDRRENVADQIEGAILYHTGELAASKIELGVRYTTSIWGWLHERDHVAPPQARWPPGVKLPPTTPDSQAAARVQSSSSGDRPQPAKKAPDKETENQHIPPFDLTDFLDAKAR